MRGHDINSREAYATSDFANCQMAVLNSIAVLNKACCRSIANYLGKQTSDITGRLDELEKVGMISRDEREINLVTGKFVWMYKLTQKGRDYFQNKKTKEA